ncbi:MAG: polyprenyl synthetase family protein [Fimbriimonadaceae bacterium]|nr:polyprenyl synthetase family protein [Fimbriimonadaceae bacterium]
MSTTFFTKLQERIPNEVMTNLIDGVLRVEAELGRQVKSEVGLVQNVGEHTLAAGGKRLRPALALLSAYATGRSFSPERVARLGACLEMIHMATLVHDDVLDRSDTRRGHPTAHSVFGDTASILSGDVLLAKSMRILALDGDLRIIRMVSDAVVEMAEGEVLELEIRGNFDLSMDEYLRVLRMKTAAFVECCCRIGAIAAEADRETEDTLGAFGHHLGMAFQMVDDVLDYVGETEKTGKPIATDFREGQMTLPLFYLREALPIGDANELRKVFGNGVTDVQLDKFAGWMDEYGAVAQARARAKEHEDEAARLLNSLPDTPERELLACITEFVTGRES